MTAPGVNVAVTTEVGYCPFCQRSRNLRRADRHLGGLVRTTVECESCHRTLSSTLGPPPPAVEAAPAPTPPPVMAEPGPAQAPKPKAEKAAPVKKAAAPKKAAVAAKRPAAAGKAAAKATVRKPAAGAKSPTRKK